MLEVPWNLAFPSVHVPFGSRAPSDDQGAPPWPHLAKERLLLSLTYGIDWGLTPQCPQYMSGLKAWCALYVAARHWVYQDVLSGPCRPRGRPPAYIGGPNPEDGTLEFAVHQENIAGLTRRSGLPLCLFVSSRKPLTGPVLL